MKRYSGCFFMILCSTVVYSNSRWHKTVFEGRKRKSFKTVISWPRAKPGKIQFVPDHQINAMLARDASRGLSCSKAHFRLHLLWFVTMGYIQNFSPRNFKKSTSLFLIDFISTVQRSSNRFVIGAITLLIFENHTPKVVWLNQLNKQQHLLKHMKWHQFQYL